MWVVFWTTHEKRDFYTIHESKNEAKGYYKQLTTEHDVYCAGYAPIKKSTDWTPAI